MRLGDEDPSGNFIDRTGRGGFGGFGGGGGGNMLGCLLPLVASRFGIVGVLVLLLGYCALTTLGGGGGGAVGDRRGEGVVGGHVVGHVGVGRLSCQFVAAGTGRWSPGRGQAQPSDPRAPGTGGV